MHVEALERKADEASRALDTARVRLERVARRWAERQGARALRDLQQTAEEFDRAQRTLEEALREWARALRGASPRSRLALASAEAH
jgi:exonuclease VII small subunit